MKMAKKSAKNVIEEWAKEVRSNANIAYDSVYSAKKNEYLQKIIGNCDIILATLDCCESDKID